MIRRFFSATLFIICANKEFKLRILFAILHAKCKTVMIREFLKYTLGFILICITHFVYSQPTDFEKQLKLADSQYASGDITGALLTLEDILVKQPDNLDAQEKKINYLVQQDRSKDAMKDIEDYIFVYPAKPEYYYLRAVLKLQDEKYYKAIEDFDRAIQLNMPAGIIYKVYLNRGMAHFYNQDFDLAEADFNEVIAQSPQSAAAHHGLGMIKYELNQYEEAIAEFQKALKLEPDNAITFFNLAMTYYRMKDDDNACYNFNKSCALGHRNACRLLMMECDINISK
jgi:tetratricopeptide (TPR) repeat protein